MFRNHRLRARVAQALLCSLILLSPLGPEAEPLPPSTLASSASPAPALPAIPHSERDIQCLTDNLYHEARGESTRGQRLVAQVTLNRTRHPDFPSTICDVVYQRYQFSWTASPKRRSRIDRASEEYQQLRQLAIDVIQAPLTIPRNVLYFYSRCMRAEAAPAERRISVAAREGCHIFYMFRPRNTETARRRTASDDT